MVMSTTPEVIEPNQLNAYDGFDFTTIVAGGLPNGGDCLRLSHAAGSEKQNLWQTVRSDSMLMQQDPVQPALSFWIRRKQNFAGLAAPATNYYSSWTPGAAGAGGMIFGVGNAPELLNGVAGYALSWGIFGTGDDDLYLMFGARLSGDAHVYIRKITDLPLDEWVFVVFNKGEQARSSSQPSGLTMQTYVNGLFTDNWNPAYSSFSGSSWPEMNDAYMSLGRFAIGDPCVSEFAVRGDADGPLVDIGEIAFHDTRLSEIEIFQLYEAMLYGP